jgi:hypothetical protein
MGVLGVYKESVTMVNRTSRPLNVRYDGEDMTLQPGENPGFPRVAVPFARNQNPLMGSKHPINPRKFISLVGVKAAPGQKQVDDITPIDEETLERADHKLEVIDRSGEFHNSAMRGNVKVLNRGFDPDEAGCGGDFAGTSTDINSGLSAKLG